VADTGALIVEHLEKAYAVARAVTESAADAEDALGEAVTRLLSGAERRDEARAFFPYFARTVVNAAHSLRRSEGRRAAREEKVMAENERGRRPEPVERDETTSAVRAALGALPPEERAAVALTHLEGLSQAEAGEALGLSQRAVSRHARDGLRRMRGRLARAGFAGAIAPGVFAAAICEPVPGLLAGYVGKLVAGAKGTAAVGSSAAVAGKGTAAAVAAAKGGVAMKAVAGIVAAGTLAGAVAVSTGALGGGGDAPLAAQGANVNPVTGRQSREEVFEFTQKPVVKKQGDKYVITFASKGKCDATVAVVDAKGRIVRHLASGVLGANAPWPFKQGSLKQTIEWEGKDDLGKPAPAGCRVKVSLGLKAAYERQFCFDPYYFPGGGFTGVAGLACDDKGLLYVLGKSFVRVFDKDGRYVRTLAPHPGTLKPEEASTYNFFPTTYGDSVILSSDRYGPFKTGLRGTVSTAAYSPAAKQLIAVLYNNDHRYASSLFRFGLDGAVRKEDLVRLSGKKIYGGVKGYLGPGTVHVAATGDGKRIYLAIATGINKRFKSGAARGGRNSHAVYCFSIDELKGPNQDLCDRKPFAGVAGEKGEDSGHFNKVRGVAVDAAGNVYVSDHGNNRIQVFAPDGSLKRTLKVDCPGQLYCHPKTSNLYCLTGKLMRKERKSTMKIKKLSSKDGSIAAVFDMPLKNTLDPVEPTFCLDPVSEPPGLWVRPFAAYTYAPQPFRIEDRGDAFEKTFTFPDPKPGMPWNALKCRPRMAVNRKTDALYVPCPTLARFDGNTGEFDKAFFEKVGKYTSPESVYVGGPDNLVHARVGDKIYGQFVIRFDRNGTPVPFKHGAKGLKMPRPFTDFPAIWTGETTECNVHQKGFAVAPNGDIYTHIIGCQKSWLEARQKGAPYAPEKAGQYFAQGQSKRVHHPLLRVFDKDGNEKIFDAIPGLPLIHGIRVDRKGDTYISALYFRKVGDNRIPFGLKRHMPFTLTMGSVLKFGDGSGTLPIAHIWKEKDAGHPEGPNNLYDSGMWGGHNKKLWCDKLQWGFFGQTGLGVNCSCHHTRIDLDGFDRVFVPSMHLFSIMVLDGNGNVIARIGRYGNADHRGKDSFVPDPKTGILRPPKPDDPPDLKSPFRKPDLAFAWVRNVMASDTAIYAMDFSNERIVKAALGYHAEEEVPLP